MGDNWYGLVLGEEMGPLSWSDLRGMAARGSLGRQQRIKPGPEAEWVAAESVSGLFDNLEELIAAPRSASHEKAVARPWYCELLGTEFGPLPWDEIRGMADRGMVRPNSRVRQEGEQEWRQAAQIEGLLATVATEESTDFDINEPPSPRSAGEADFEIAASPSKASPPVTADDDMPGKAKLATEADGGESTVPRNPEEPPPEDGLPRPSTTTPDGLGRPSSAPTQAIASAPAEAHDRPKGFFAKFHRKAKPTEAPAPPSVQPTPSASAAATNPAAPKKPAAKTPPPAPKRASEAKERVGVSDASKRVLLGLLALVCLGAVGYGGYVGVVALASMRGANYNEILAGYDRLYEQAKKAQTDPAMSTNPQMGMQFVSTLSRLRAPLHNAAPGTIDDKLNQAGTRLAELFSTAAAAPGSEQSEHRATVDADYQTLMASIRGELGGKK